MRQLQRLFKGRGRQQLKPLAQIIAGLFKGGAPGAWYDPSDINLNWRYNLLTYTEQFDNAVWTKTSVAVLANAAAAPDGSTTADKIVPDTTSAFHLVSQSATPSGQYTISLYAKASGYDKLALSVQFVSSATFDLTLGTVVAGGAAASISSVGGGWYRCSYTFTRIGTSNIELGVARQSDGTWNGWVGNGTDGIYIWGASLTTAANASLPYQQIVTPEISYLNYQPQPILFQDSAGTTPVTAVEQPVGLMLDKSQGLVLGPELVTNGDFTSAAGWTLPGTGTNLITGGKAVLSGASGYLYRTNTSITAGRWYRVQFTVSGYSGSGTARPYLQASPVFGTNVTGNGTFSQYLLATTTSSNTEVGLNFASAFTASIDDVSIKELPGNHAFQATSASRPVLSARVNQLLNTAFAGAVAGSPGTAPTNWSANGTGGSISAVGPETITVMASANRLYLTPTPAYSAAIGSHTSRVVVTAVTAGLSFTTLFDVLPSTATSTNTYYANGILVNSGTYVVSAGDVLTILSSVTVAGTLSYRFGLGPSAPVTGTATFTQPDIRATNVGVNLPAYQRVNTSTDYATTGFLPYLKFDGVDDSLSTNSINFTSTDKMSVFAGVRKLSDSTIGSIAELSTDANSNAGTFWVFAPSGGGNTNWNFRSRGTTGFPIATQSGKPAPDTAVLTGIGNISGDITQLRYNGVIATTDTADQGTGNYGNHPLYIGRRNNASLPFNGQLYSMIIVGKAVTAGELSSSEKFIASKIGVTL